MAPGNRITVGMLALGRQAMGRNLTVFLRWPDTEVVALCDVGRWRLDPDRERFLNSEAVNKLLTRQPGRETWKVKGRAARGIFPLSTDLAWTSRKHRERHGFPARCTRVNR